MKDTSPERVMGSLERLDAWEQAWCAELDRRLERLRQSRAITGLSWDEVRERLKTLAES